MYRGGCPRHETTDWSRNIFCNPAGLFTYEAASRHRLKITSENNRNVDLISRADDNSSIQKMQGQRQGSETYPRVCSRILSTWRAGFVLREREFYAQHKTK
jgi:hypothetical protein